jgi:hypothetical protein
MTRRLGSFRTVLADRNLRRVELAFLGFNMTEFATWIAILVYAFERGGAAEMGAVSAILLVPSAVVAPLAAYAGDRFRRDRVLAVDYVVQGLALGTTAATLYADAPAGLVYAAATIASISITFTRPAQNSLLPALTPTGPDHRGHPAGDLGIRRRLRRLRGRHRLRRAARGEAARGRRSGHARGADRRRRCLPRDAPGVRDPASRQRTSPRRAAPVRRRDRRRRARRAVRGDGHRPARPRCRRAPAS